MFSRRDTGARRAVARGFAALLATSLVLQVGPGRAAPADMFSIPAPALTAEPAKAAELNAGSTSVSPQTGALQYSYPIRVPPGRNGAAPSISLSYSSQAPIYGGVAAGWQLAGLHEIREDTSQGRLRTHDRIQAIIQTLSSKNSKFDPSTPKEEKRSWNIWRSALPMRSVTT